MSTTLSKHMSLGIIWCLMVSSVGCYTLQPIESPKELNGISYRGKQIWVETKDSVIYVLSDWVIHDNGDIEGKGNRQDNSQGTKTTFDGRLMSADISRISTEELEVVRITAAVVAGIGLFAVAPKELAFAVLLVLIYAEEYVDWEETFPGEHQNLP